MSNSDGPGSLFQEMADEIAARDAEIARLRAERDTLRVTLDAEDQSKWEQWREKLIAVKAERARLAGEIARLRAETESYRDNNARLRAERDAFRVALNNVSGALVDSGIEFRDDYSRYGEAVRKLVDQRADARNKADHLQAIACPGCGGPTTHDRELPPNPYLCLKCAAKQIAEDMEDPEPCETCGGSRRIDGEFTREDGTKQGWFDHCPDCTPDTVDFAHGSDPSTWDDAVTEQDERGECKGE